MGPHLVDDQRELDFASNLCIAMLVATAVSLALLVPHALGPWLLVPGGTLLTSAPSAAVACGESLDVAFDLHHFALCMCSICRCRPPARRSAAPTPTCRRSCRRSSRSSSPAIIPSRRRRRPRRRPATTEPARRRRKASRKIDEPHDRSRR